MNKYNWPEVMRERIKLAKLGFCITEKLICTGGFVNALNLLRSSRLLELRLKILLPQVVQFQQSVPF